MSRELTTLTREAARDLTDEVKADAQALWEKCLRLYEGEAHTALQYASWADYWSAEFGGGKSRAYQILDAARVTRALPESTMVEPPNERQARELVRLRDDEAELVEVWRDVRAEHGEKVTAEKVRDAVTARMKREQVVSNVAASNSFEWYTPRRYVEAAREVLGCIDLDPASSEVANRTVGARRIFTADDDGLSHDWPGRVWLNPPYGRLCPQFVAHLLDQVARGITTAAVLLVSAYSTDTAWFEPLFDYPPCFVRGRIEFDSPSETPSTPPFASVFAYLGPHEARFLDRFSDFGAVVRRHPASAHATELRAAA